MNNKGFMTFYGEDKDYKPPSSEAIKDMLSQIGINPYHNAMIRNWVHIIVNDNDKIDLEQYETDSQFQKAVKEKILKGEKSFILKV